MFIYNDIYQYIYQHKYQYINTRTHTHRWTQAGEGAYWA